MHTSYYQPQDDKNNIENINIYYKNLYLINQEGDDNIALEHRVRYTVMETISRNLPMYTKFSKLLNYFSRKSKCIFFGNHRHSEIQDRKTRDIRIKDMIVILTWNVLDLLT